MGCKSPSYVRMIDEEDTHYLCLDCAKDHIQFLEDKLAWHKREYKIGLKESQLYPKDKQ